MILFDTIEKQGTAKKLSPSKKKRFIVADIYGDYIQTAVIDTVDAVVYPLTTRKIMEYKELSKTDSYYNHILEVYENWQKEETMRA